MADSGPGLKQSLSGLHLWGIAVGLVISGEYFGWSYGWAQAGTLGFLLTTVIIAVMYLTFIFSYTELTTAIPHAGGPFAYGFRAFGPLGGYIAGFSTLVEFLFAPPAIALAIGAYLNVQFPPFDPRSGGRRLRDIHGAQHRRRHDRCHLRARGHGAGDHRTADLHGSSVRWLFLGTLQPSGLGRARPSLGSLSGIFAAIPFAIWFFLAIEGAAMAAEEARDPRRTIPRAYIAGIITLVLLAFGTMMFAGGVGDWTVLSNINDPLPQAMKIVVGAGSGWLHLLVWIGLLGLIASFHGIIIGYSRQIFALARAGLLPRPLAAIHPRWRTPHLAILAGGVVGISAIYSDRLVTIAGQPLTASIVTMSALGAIVMYIVSLLSLMRLRTREPQLQRPFRVPLYPLFPLIALVIAVASLLAIVYYNVQVAALFAGMGVVGAVVTRGRVSDPTLQASAAATSASRLSGVSDGA